MNRKKLYAGRAQTKWCTDLVVHPPHSNNLKSQSQRPQPGGDVSVTAELKILRLHGAHHIIPAASAGAH
jgi:hypothetical protein